MPDGGQTLRQKVQGQADFPAWGQILREYAALQIAASQWEADFAASGLPIRAAGFLKSAYLDMLTDESISLIGNSEDELNPEQHAQLLRIAPQVGELLDELASLGVPLSLEHGDLHDANVFARGNGYCIYDWGDASFTHPFFTLLLPIRHIAEKLGCSEYDPHPELIQLLEAYMQPWSDFASRPDLLRAWDLAHYLAKFVRAINWYRVLKATEPGLADNCRLSVARSVFGISPAQPRPKLK